MSEGMAELLNPLAKHPEMSKCAGRKTRKSFLHQQTSVCSITIILLLYALITALHGYSIWHITAFNINYFTHATTRHQTVKKSNAIMQTVNCEIYFCLP